MCRSKFKTCNNFFYYFDILWLKFQFLYSLHIKVENVKEPSTFFPVAMATYRPRPRKVNLLHSFCFPSGFLSLSIITLLNVRKRDDDRKDIAVKFVKVIRRQDLVMFKDNNYPFNIDVFFGHHKREFRQMPKCTAICSMPSAQERFILEHFVVKSNNFFFVYNRNKNKKIHQSMIFHNVGNFFFMNN